MTDKEGMERLIRALELLASATDRQARCAEQQIELQTQMVANQKKMAEGTAALEQRLAPTARRKPKGGRK